MSNGVLLSSERQRVVKDTLTSLPAKANATYSKTYKGGLLHLCLIYSFHPELATMIQLGALLLPYDCLFH